MSDADLMERAQAGDRTAFNELHRRHEKWILTYCRAATGPAGEDVAQEVWVAVVQQLPALRGESFKNWLARVAHNKIVDQHRRNKRWKPSGSGDDVLALRDSVAATDDDFLADASLAAELLQALAKLPLAQRELLVLSFYLGFTHEEIADLLRIARPTVTDRISKAKTALSSLLTDPRSVRND